MNFPRVDLAFSLTSVWSLLKCHLLKEALYFLIKNSHTHRSPKPILITSAWFFFLYKFLASDIPLYICLMAVLTPSLNARFKKERSQDVACPHGPFPPRVRDPNVTLPSSEIIRTL